MTRAEELRLIAKAAADHPIPDYNAPPVKPDPMSELRTAEAAQAAADREKQEQKEAAGIRQWVTKSMPRSSGAPAAASTAEMCDLVVAIISPIIEDMARQIDGLKQQVRLCEQRETAVETRAVAIETRTAKVEDRAFSAASGLSAYSGNTAH
jgi:hypothetical protein